MDQATEEGTGTAPAPVPARSSSRCAATFSRNDRRSTVFGICSVYSCNKCWAVCNTVAIGNKTLTAAYAGDSNFSGSTSAGEPHTVTRTNQPPTANADTYTTLEDHALIVNAANGVLKNDTDPDMGETPTAVKVGDPSHGTLTLNSDGSFSYTPDPDFNGTDSFSYKARDSLGAVSPVAIVSLGITSVADAPTFTKGPNVTVRPAMPWPGCPAFATGTRAYTATVAYSVSSPAHIPAWVTSYGTAFHPHVHPVG